MIVVATEEEKRLAQKEFPFDNIVVTGVGGLNVIKRLQYYSRETPIINYGYAGSNSLPIGTKVTVGRCRLYHPSVEYREPIYTLGGNVDCYTSNDFVTSTEIKDPAVFDMELAYILALGFLNVQSIKIISDNLSLEQYEEEIKK